MHSDTPPESGPRRLYSIGELARRTGLTVKAVRFYADRGIVPPTGRSRAGHRRYTIEAVARLELVRTLRALGVDLPTIRRVINQEITLADVAATHVEALEAQIRILRVRRAVLTALAGTKSNTEEMDLMHKLARLSEQERRNVVDEFLATAFGDVDTDPAFSGIRRSMTPQLPDEPDADQIQAWLELTELAQDRGFRASMRHTVQQYAAERATYDTATVRRDAIATIRDHVTPELAAGTDPSSPRGESVVAAVMAEYARLISGRDSVELRRQLLARVEAANDPHRERYLHLLGVVNGWIGHKGLIPALTWFREALAARMAPG